MTLDKLARDRGFGDESIFIKIDVEGHEPSVLAGAAGLIAGAVPPSFLIEILTPKVVEGVAVALPTSRFRYRFVDERNGALVDVVTPMKTDIDGEGGNYIVTPL